MKKPDALVPIIWAMGAVGYGLAGAVWKDDAPWVLNLSLTTLVIMAAMFGWLAHVRDTLAYEQGLLIEAQNELIDLLNEEIELLKNERQA